MPPVTMAPVTTAPSGPPSVTFYSGANGSGQSITIQHVAELEQPKTFANFNMQSASVQNGASFSFVSTFADGTTQSFGMSAGQTGTANFPTTPSSGNIVGGKITINNEFITMSFAQSQAAVVFWSLPNGTGQSVSVGHLGDMFAQLAQVSWTPVSATVQNGGHFLFTITFANGSTQSIGMTAGQTGSVDLTSLSKTGTPAHVDYVLNGDELKA